MGLWIPSDHGWGGENTWFTGNYLLGTRDGIKNPETGHKSWLTLGLCHGHAQKISVACLLCVRNELFLKWNRERVKDTENKQMVARGKDVGERED